MLIFHGISAVEPMVLWVKHPKNVGISWQISQPILSLLGVWDMIYTQGGFSIIFHIYLSLLEGILHVRLLKKLNVISFKDQNQILRILNDETDVYCVYMICICIIYILYTYYIILLVISHETIPFCWLQ